MVKFAIIIPIYWVMMSLSCYKALWQLVSNPSFLEKTMHGLHNGKYDTVGDLGRPARGAPDLGRYGSALFNDVGKYGTAACILAAD